MTLKPPISIVPLTASSDQWLTRRVRLRRLSACQRPESAGVLTRCLTEAAQVLASRREPRAVLHDLLRRVAERLDCTGGVWYGCEPGRVRLKPVAWWVGPSGLRVALPPLEFAFEHGSTVTLPVGEGTNLLAAPVIGAGGSRRPGVLVLCRDDSEVGFTHHELEIATVVATAAGPCLAEAAAASSRRPGRAGRFSGSELESRLADETLTSALLRVQREAPGGRTSARWRDSRTTRRRRVSRRLEVGEPVGADTVGGVALEQRRAQARGDRAPLTLELLFGGRDVLPDYLKEE